MGRPARTFQSLADEWLSKAIPNGTCLESHLVPSDKGYIPSYYGYVHRVIFEAIKGPIGNLFVLHKCDNPKCINPDHLFLGTIKDNVDDMRAKGRSNYIGTPKITTSEQRLRMKTLQEEGWTHKEIAAEFHVSKNTVWRCLRGDYD